jgi:hypothetical protein
MLAIGSTLVFLATIWLVAVVALRMIEQSGSRILAALKGHAPVEIGRPALVPVRVRYRAATQVRPVHARPKLRAAA